MSTFSNIIASLEKTLLEHDNFSILECNSKYWSLLDCALENGWIDVLLSLASRIHNLDARDIKGETTLHKAARSMTIGVVSCLVDRGADVNAKCNIGATPLLYGTMFNRRDVFDLLLDAGANADGCCEDKLTVLHYVTLNGWFDAIPSLLERVPDLNATDQIGGTALHHAAMFGHVEVAKCLVEKGVNINAIGYKGATPLMYAAMHSHKDVFDVLLNAGADIAICDDEERSVLHYAAVRNQSEWTEAVQYLVTRVPDLEATDKKGMTALHMACSGTLETVKCLVEKGANINARCEQGATPLLCAAENCHRDIFNLLMYAGANVDFYANEFPVLHFALHWRWTEEVQYLVKRVHDLEVRNSRGWTALHQALLIGNIEGVICLVEAGADVNSRTKTGVTPLLYAAMAGHRNIFELFYNAGANLEGCSEDKSSMLHHASRLGWLDLVLILLCPDLNKNDKTVWNNASIDINARNKYGETAMHLACKFQNLDVVEYLFQAHASCDSADIYGNSPLGYLIRMERPDVKLVKLFIENVAVLLPKDYDAMVKISLLKVEILQDIKFCCQVIINKFNNYNLPQLYKLPVAGSLPRIEKMKIQSRSEVFQALQQSVRFEIETEGHCTQLNEHPKALSVLCVKSVLEYYEKKNRTSKLAESVG